MAELITLFTPNASHFAFSSNIAHKNTISVFPVENNGHLNPSFTINYEDFDLKGSEIQHFKWVSLTKEQPKRKRGAEAESNTSTEHYLVNVFPNGKIVVFKDGEIVNIIENKKEVLQIDSHGEDIWFLDEEMTVKCFKYDSSKKTKTFHLVDGKNDEISGFNCITFDSKLYIAISTEEVIYIIDPSKKRPSTFSKIPLFGAINVAQFGENLAITDMENLRIVKLDGQEIASWGCEADGIVVCGDKIAALTSEGSVEVFSIDGPLMNASVEGQNVVELASTGESVVLAWMDVNEPRFDVIADFTKDIVFEGAQPVEEEEDHVKVTKKTAKVVKKLSKYEQDTLVSSLFDAFSKEVDISGIVVNEDWTEFTICEVIKEIDSKQVLTLFDNVSRQFVEEPLATSKLNMWLKWLLILRRAELPTKNTKSLKNSLKVSATTLSTLLSIQGKLELLKAQSELRDQISQFAIDEDVKATEEEKEEPMVVIVNGEGDDEDDEEVEEEEEEDL